ncbi:translocation/assembly module TamB domain-containing protein [Algoriphagus halophytocola]|uniref:Translocation/assembly module TamB domain-containing protein n=1 Tax=Algoriphagus halophytocola TaxID=2991499 RepID=A0ABY6MN34_9BACT|nr:translocation/assembly module TamB domain-containing protein [Algoriphagus sp. TR-M5]UZD24419.1 translocation/assembly module TamB domain-containing protein [Algoriphagus sp. TR-M5]
MKILGITIAVILVIVGALILFIRSPWGQGIIVDKATSYVSDKTGTEVSIERLFITFSGNIYLEELYLEDTKGDTLVYSKNLEAGVAFGPLLTTGNISVTKLDWEGLVARVSRSAETEQFNFDFLIEAFASQAADSTQTVAADTTASDPMTIKLSPISLRDFDITYLDEVMGIDASILLGELDLTIPGLDLEEYEFDIKEVALKNTKIKYHQTKPFPPAEESTEETPMPIVNVDELTLSNVSADYVSEPDQQKAEVQIGNLLVELRKADLRTQSIELTTIALNKSSILFHDFSTDTPVESSESTSESAPFAWPDWIVEAEKIDIDSTNIEYKSADVAVQKGSFNPEAFVISNLRFDAEDLFLKDEEVGASLQEFNFQEGSGFALKEFQFELEAGNDSAELDNLLLATNRSTLVAEIQLEYPSIQALIDDYESLKFDLEVHESKLDVRDSYFFDPTLAQDTLIRELAKDPILLDLIARGDLKDIDIPSLNLHWGESDFSANGMVKNPMDVDLLSFDFPEINLLTNRETLLKFAKEEDYGVKFPEQIDLQASASGMLDDLLADLDLQTDMGNILLAGTYQNDGQLAFDADLKVDQLQLGNLLKQPELDTLTFEIIANGSGSDLNTLNAELSSTFERLRLYGSDYSGLKLKGKLEDGAGDLEAGLDSEFLDFEMLTLLDLDSVNSIINLNLDLEGADFYALGLTANSSRARLKLDADFEGNFTEFDLKTLLHEGTILYDGKNYPLGNITAEASVREDSTSLDIASKVINGFVRTNTNPSDLTAALTAHFSHYLDKLDSASQIGDGDIVMNMDLKLSSDPLLSEVLLQGLEQFDSAKIQADYFQEIDSLTATIEFPYVNYAGTEVDSLGLRIRSNENIFRLYFGFAQLTSGPVNMDETFLTGQLADSRLYFDFHSYEGAERNYHLSSDIGLDGDTLSYHVSSIDLILKGQQWTIPENNFVKYSGESLEFKDFTFGNGNQEISFANNVEGFTDENIAMLFENFRLSTFTSLLNPEEVVAGGRMDGRLVVENPFGATGIMGDLKVDSLKVLAVPLGNLSLEATAKNLGDYILKLQLRDDGVELDLDGSYVAKDTGGEFDLQIELNRFEMDKIGALSGDQIRDASGYLSGTINAKGTTNDPQYKGTLKFQEASFIPAQLSTKYLLSSEEIALDNAGIYLDDFTVRDEEGNTFIVDGTVFTESYINPSFDLQMTADNFMVINSTDEDADLFYGRGTIDADVSIQGDLTLPIVNAKLNVKENTDLTVIIPESQADLVERQGVVVFVNKANPDDILTRQLEETTDVFSGYDISAILSTDPGAVFTIVIDEASGDNLAISGDSNLSLDIDPNGRITLSGSYEVNDGHYEMSLYNLVSRRFELANGGRITWNGDPMDATMDLQAVYRVDASPAELMSSQLSGTSDESRAQYNQKLDFIVYLNVDGELLRPEISFTLDMPENERGAFGGNVYSRVMQINEQQDELNKQVFSLLVLNRFFPSTGSDGASGGAEAIARNSVSQILSDQLNALSSKLFGDTGLSVGFDVDSYQGYQGDGPQNRTELNINAQQRLFNDRLVVQVGSQVDLEGAPASEQNTANSILANISFEYMLTEDGRWRIRAFRKNQFESIIDGQLIVTGGGLIFNREFNYFRNLWKPADTSDQSNPIDELKESKESKKEQKKQEKEERRKAKATKNQEENED